MKIILTQEEAKRMVTENIRARLAYDGWLSVDVEIQSPTSTATSTTNAIPPASVHKIINDIESLNYHSTQKIEAIKRFRTLIPGTSLAEAKWVIENWNTWSRKALVSNGIPTLKSIGGYGYTVD